MKGYKRLTALMLTLVMVFSLGTSSLAEEEVTPVLISEHPMADVDGEIAAILAYYENAESLDDWELICGLNGAGYDMTEVYGSLEWTTDMFTDQTASFYGSRMMALLAMNINPNDYMGTDLVSELVAMMNEEGSFGTPTDQLYAMMALDAVGADYSSEKALEALAGMQNEDGGFGYALGSSDVDSTGVTLIALSNHIGTTKADEMIKKAVAYLKLQQMETGGFGSWGSENSNSTARAISGLVAIGEDVYSESWLKEDVSMVDVLLTYKMDDGSYTWVLEPMESNAFSTKQVLMALADLKNGEAVLAGLELMTVTYDLRVEGITETILDDEFTLTMVGDINVKAALENALNLNEIEYNFDATQYGSYLTQIASESMGTFGGYDGWMYLVNGFSGMGVDADLVAQGDDLVFYYGDMAPATLIPRVTIPTMLGKDEPLLVKVSATYYSYDADWNPTEVTDNVDGVDLMFNSKSYTTDMYGLARIPQSEVLEGVNTYSIAKNNEEAVPSILRESGQVTIEIDDTALYADDSNIADWAYDAIYGAREIALIVGYQNEVMPKQELTKEQLIIMFMRLSDDYDVAYDVPEIVDGDMFVTRADYASMIVDFYELEAVSMENTYTDLDNIDPETLADILAVTEAGLFQGYNNKYLPEATISREMAAVVMLRIKDMITE